MPARATIKCKKQSPILASNVPDLSAANLHSTSDGSMSVSVFFLGATGYIGGSLLKAILASPLAEQFKITALYRSPKDEARLASLGVTPLKGDLVADPETVKAAAYASDLVIDCAHSDTSVQAILAGLAQQHAETGKKPVYIHTSGTGVLSDNSLGMFEGGKVYDVR